MNRTLDEIDELIDSAEERFESEINRFRDRDRSKEFPREEEIWQELHLCCNAYSLLRASIERLFDQE